MKKHTEKQASPAIEDSAREPITYNEMKAALERAVAERGEGYVYKPQGEVGERVCLYRHQDGQPGCIVGLAMSYLRPDVTLEEHKEAEVSLSSYATNDAIVLANYAQMKQDDGVSWGSALVFALAAVEEDAP